MGYAVIFMPYLVCGECGKYYQLQEGESPENFLLSCTCGGRLILTESLDDIESLDGTELLQKQEEQHGYKNKEVSNRILNSDELVDAPNLAGLPKTVQNPLTLKFFKISSILAIFGILIISASIIEFSDGYGFISSNENEKYSQEQISCFLETTFSQEYHGQCHDRVGKWNINVVRIKIFGSPTPEDMNTLNKAINDINVNAKSFRMVIDDKNQFEPDMEIYFIPHSQFVQYSVNPSEADGFTEWLVSTSSIYGGNPAGEIFKVRVFIGSDQLSQARRSHVIVHELGHCLGFHHNQNRNSVLCYQGPVITEFTDLDKTMIRMLYREDILPNMSRNQVETILNNSRRSFFF